MTKRSISPLSLSEPCLPCFSDQTSDRISFVLLRLLLRDRTSMTKRSISPLSLSEPGITCFSDQTFDRISGALLGLLFRMADKLKIEGEP